MRRLMRKMKKKAMYLRCRKLRSSSLGRRKSSRKTHIVKWHGEHH
jgi:hypothetical protein